MPTLGGATNCGRHVACTGLSNPSALCLHPLVTSLDTGNLLLTHLPPGSIVSNLLTRPSPQLAGLDKSAHVVSLVRSRQCPFRSRLSTFKCTLLYKCTAALDTCVGMHAVYAVRAAHPRRPRAVPLPTGTGLLRRCGRAAAQAVSEEGAAPEHTRRSS